jgi:hypothetical protein
LIFNKNFDENLIGWRKGKEIMSQAIGNSIELPLRILSQKQIFF